MKHSLFSFLSLAFWGVLFAFSLVPFPGIAQETPPESPIVLELFSSQGCSFCPPADVLLGDLAKQKGIIALSCHVDYFNIQSNALGIPACTSRQTTYNRLIGTGPRYTPQLVVNGHMDMIGYETGKISAALLRGRSDALSFLPITQTDTQTEKGSKEFTLSLPALLSAEKDPLTLWLVVYMSPQTLPIMDGRNLGKSVRYTNVVESVTNLGAWDGTAGSKTLSAFLSGKAAGFAVLAQSTRTGKIFAAGKIDLPFVAAESSPAGE